jgi:energy-coupling factor transport system permease protein
MEQAVRFDPRSKLCFVVLTNFILLVTIPFQVEAVFVSCLAAVLFLNGSRKMAIAGWLAFWGLTVCDTFFLQYQEHGFFMLCSFFVVGGRKMLPTLLVACFLLRNTKISEWIVCLRKFRLPFQLIVPLVILFRFFPTLLQEFKQVKKALKFRGIARGPLDFMRHPLQNFEYVVVPLILSADSLAVDLSAVALVRGMGNQGVKTSIQVLTFRLQDYLVFIFSVCFIFGKVVFW